MKYLKSFEKSSDYQSFINGGGVSLPNVSYCKKENEVHYKPLVQQNNEIWYTSTDGNIVKPYSSSTTPFFDADGNNIEIVSNTYENGKGIIKLNADLYGIGSYITTYAPSYPSLFLETNVLTLSFPSSLSQITQSIIHQAEYTSIIGMYFNSINPPKLSGYLFTAEFDMSIYQNLSIYVPSNSVDTYKTADRWSDYADKIQPIP